MENNRIIRIAQQESATINLTVNGRPYQVILHISPSAKETPRDKLKRILRNEAARLEQCTAQEM